MKEGERGILWVLGALVLVLLVGPVLMGGMMGPGIMGPGMMGWSTTPGAATNTSGWLWGLVMGLGGLMMLAFWGALIAGIVLLVRWAGGQRQGASYQPGADEPLAILRRRYAAGEIDEATYQRMKTELGNAAESLPRQAA
jgi:putative membrane protein